MNGIELRWRRVRLVAKWGGLGCSVLLGVVLLASYRWTTHYDGLRRQVFLGNGTLCYRYFEGTDADLAKFRSRGGVLPRGNNLTYYKSYSDRKLQWSFKARTYPHTITNSWLNRLATGAPATVNTGITSHYVFVPILPIFLGLLVLSAIVLWLTRARTQVGHCVFCSYDLTGNVTGICPECGTSIISIGNEACANR